MIKVIRINDASVPAHAYDGNEDVQEIYLEDGVESVGNFAFNRCRGLKYLRLPASLEFFGDGAIRGCDSLKLIDAWITEDRLSMMENLITNIDSEITVRFHLIKSDKQLSDAEDSADISDENCGQDLSDEKYRHDLSDENYRQNLLDENYGQDLDANYNHGSLDDMHSGLLAYETSDFQLVFPDYVNIAMENTMARKIQFDIQGAGYSYRETVSWRGINFYEYDRLFTKAVTEYNNAKMLKDSHEGADSAGHNIPSAAEIAVSRLYYPVELSDASAEKYRDFLFENSKEILNALAAFSVDDLVIGDLTNDTVLRFLYKEQLIQDGAADMALATAAGRKDAQLSALIIQLSHEYNNPNKSGTAQPDYIFSL